jgi:HSP20 family molecular chaperone IbpA
MKKRSFFERLAGNLRFDDTEDEQIVETQQKEPVRDLPLKTENSFQKPQEEIKEEVGELPVDVYETPNEIIIQTLIAGVLPDNLSISITRDMVTIKGKREENKGIPQDQYVIKELYWGSFARTVQLPAEVEIDTSEAIERHGMLMIKLPKTDRGRKTVLKINPRRY